MSNLDERIKNGKTKLGKKIPCILEVITPVHIGSGVKLQKDIDFSATNDSLILVSQEQLLTHLEKNPEELERFSQNSTLASLKMQPDGTTYYGTFYQTRDLLQFVRSGNGNPYIPGSSLKGAIRTVFFKKLFQKNSDTYLQKLDTRKKEKSAEKISNSIFNGSDKNRPNYDFFRALRIFDIPVAPDNIGIVDVAILSMTGPSEFGWKDMRGKQNIAIASKATHLYSESLLPGTAAVFSLQIEDFLFENEKAKKELNFSQTDMRPENISVLINAYSREKLEKEIKFLNDINSGKQLDPVLKSIKKIYNSIPVPGSEDEKKGFFLRLGWGSGWKSMTGDALTDRQLTDIREKLVLGKKKFPVFPKSRKIVFENGIPDSLTGWVKITLNSTIANLKPVITEKNLTLEEDMISKLSHLGTIRAKQDKQRRK
jgi:CRISPR-associated protein Csm5